jgi:hypothetical protein
LMRSIKACSPMGETVDVCKYAGERQRRGTARGVAGLR